MLLIVCIQNPPQQGTHGADAMCGGDDGDDRRDDRGDDRKDHRPDVDDDDDDYDDDEDDDEETDEEEEYGRDPSSFNPLERLRKIWMVFTGTFIKLKLKGA